MSKKSSLRHERHYQRLRCGNTCFARANTAVITDWCQHDDRLEVAHLLCYPCRRTNNIHTRAVPGCVRESSTAYDWLERVIICTIGSVLATRRDAPLVPRNFPSISASGVCGGCLVRTLYGCRKP